MMEFKKVLINIKSKLISEVISIFEIYFDESHIQDTNYIISLVDYCLLDLMNTEKLNLLYIELGGLHIELDGLYGYDSLNESVKINLRTKLKNMMEELECLIKKEYEINE